MQTSGNPVELILPRQAAIRLLLLSLVLLGLTSAFSYIAGNASAPVPVVAPPPKPLAVPPPVMQVVLPAPNPVEQPVPSPAMSQPLAGRTYLQMGAVERGVGEVFVEFLKRRGLPAVLAPGPNAEIYRVLVGPLKDLDEITRVQAELQAAGFSTFLRRYRQTSAP